MHIIAWYLSLIHLIDIAECTEKQCSDGGTRKKEEDEGLLIFVMCCFFCNTYFCVVNLFIFIAILVIT